MARFAQAIWPESGQPATIKKNRRESMSAASGPFFPDVTLAWRAATFIEGDEIPATEFLDAASKFIPIFGNYVSRDGKFFSTNILYQLDRLGSVFAPVKSDIGGNILKLKKSSSQHPDKRSIQSLIISEKAAGKHDSNGPSSALLWFSRCLPRMRISVHIDRRI